MTPINKRAGLVMALAVVGAVALAPFVAHADWTQWRGPNRDGGI